MPKREDLKTILIIGSGPIVIGQACEFDYSGTQACKALREEGYEVVLVNSNPATIMTDPELADRTYIEPLDAARSSRRSSSKERPDALLPTLGGQTALNLALALAERGVLEKLRRRADRRQRRGDRARPRTATLFKEAMEQDRPRGAAQRLSPRSMRRGRRRCSTRRRLSGDHPPVVHARRHGRRHRLQPRGVRGDRAPGPRRRRRRTKC